MRLWLDLRNFLLLPSAFILRLAQVLVPPDRVPLLLSKRIRLYVHIGVHLFVEVVNQLLVALFER